MCERLMGHMVLSSLDFVEDGLVSRAGKREL